MGFIFSDLFSQDLSEFLTKKQKIKIKTVALTDEEHNQQQQKSLNFDSETKFQGK